MSSQVTPLYILIFIYRTEQLFIQPINAINTHKKKNLYDSCYIIWVCIFLIRFRFRLEMIALTNQIYMSNDKKGKSNTIKATMTNIHLDVSHKGPH